MWKVFAGLCIRRPAVVSPQLTPIQRRVQEFYADVELQRSHLSLHEVAHRKDLERMAQLASEQPEGNRGTSRLQVANIDKSTSLLTAKDLEIAWEASEKEFWKSVKDSGRIGSQIRAFFSYFFS